MEYFKKCVLQNYANFDGRARRKEYWHYALWCFIVGIVASVLDTVLGTGQAFGGSGIGIISMIVSLALMVPGLAVTVRRLHDIGKSGWYYFVAFIPLVGGIILLVWMLKAGNEGENEYGPDPKAVA